MVLESLAHGNHERLKKRWTPLSCVVIVHTSFVVDGRTLKACTPALRLVSDLSNRYKREQTYVRRR